MGYYHSRLLFQFVLADGVNPTMLTKLYNHSNVNTVLQFIEVNLVYRPKK